MKYALLLIVGLILASCGTRVPYTNSLRNEFGLDSEKNIKNVQFYVSSTITLRIVKESGNTATDESGALVSNSSKDQEEIIIYPGTTGVFEEFGENGGLIIRFETGVGNTLRFATRQNMTSGRYYLVAAWERNKGGRLEYGNKEYYATTASGQAFLQVLKKKLQKTKRKRRVVKGMKV